MENDKVEFKETWRDEYLKVIASFANNDGGILYVGVKDNGILSAFLRKMQRNFFKIYLTK